MTLRLYRAIWRRLRAVTTDRDLISTRQRALRACFEGRQVESVEADTELMRQKAMLQALAEDVLQWQSFVDELVRLHELYGITKADETDESGRRWQQQVRERAAAQCGLQLPGASPTASSSSTSRRKLKRC
ncbi:hypothetical protein CCYA_CCYA16G4222 [Cyanidiococcus yangmingshanensis]|nr:hypothetical protein CCYA_CCYA16G4222 [Cyanidiococcus yangmingshanensis]